MLTFKFNSFISKAMALLLCCLASGCSYLHDRGRDACDMITLSAEQGGFNASIQVTEAVVGVGMSAGKGFGIRSGSIGTYEYFEGNMILFGGKVLLPNDLSKCRNKGYQETYLWFPWNRDNEDEYREKYSNIHQNKDDDKFDKEFDLELHDGKWVNYFQIECAACAGVGARVGFNAAEILDFILGWTTLDICKDDIAGLNNEELKLRVISQKAERKN